MATIAAQNASETLSDLTDAECRDVLALMAGALPGAFGIALHKTRTGVIPVQAQAGLDRIDALLAQAGDLGEAQA